jgi:hypothetical protein
LPAAIRPARGLGRRSLEALERDLDPRPPISPLDVAKAQRVEIAKTPAPCACAPWRD